MKTRWEWIFEQMGNRLWLRSTLFALMGLIAALLGAMLEGVLPLELPHKIGVEGVDDVLHIMASSMLMVTTFSLSVMVSSYTAAANAATPRCTQLLLSDNTSQNALSTFIGSFLFSLVGILALKAHVYSDQGLLILFLVTLLMIFLVVLTLIRWVGYLSNLGRVGPTIDRIENVALAEAEQYCQQPYLGGKRLQEERLKADFPYPVTLEIMGYIQHIDVAHLDCVAKEEGLEIALVKRPGCFNDSVNPLAFVSKDISVEVEQQLVSGFSLGRQRSFAMDPRYGLIVLSEIASKALSPGINDPGTAIDVITRQLRILLRLGQADQQEVLCSHLHVVEVSARDLLEDAVYPIARDGGGMIEVATRLTKALQVLNQSESVGLKQQLPEVFSYVQGCAINRLTEPSDQERIRTMSL